jgi:hypothetical protein
MDGWMDGDVNQRHTSLSLSLSLLCVSFYLLEEEGGGYVFGVWCCDNDDIPHLETNDDGRERGGTPVGKATKSESSSRWMCCV